MQNLTYRSNDSTRWGNGVGSDLTAVLIDLNFWNLFSAVTTLENNQTTSAGIDYMTMQGDQLYVHLTNHAVLGPFTVPTAIWNPRGDWAPITAYAALDVVVDNGSVYVVNVSHVSASTFSAGATDGNGHDLYTLILEQPANQIPSGGTVGQRLVKSTSSPYVTAWESDKLRLSCFANAAPQPGEVLIQYGVVDHCVLPAGLAGSVVYAAIPPSAAATFVINVNGVAVGSITLSPSPKESVSFSADVNLIPGDIVTLVSPATQDATLAQVSFTLVALLTE